MQDFSAGMRRIGQGPRNRIAIARTHLINGDYEEAIAECKTALHLNPRFASAHLLLASIYTGVGCFYEAIEASKAALESDPETHRAHFLMARCYKELGRDQEAIAACEKELTINPHNIAAYLLLGGLYFSVDEYAKARSAYGGALERNPQIPLAYYKLANIYLAEHREQEAFEQVEAALQRGRSRVLLGDVYLARKDYAAAQQEYELACSLNSLNAEAHQKLGEVYFEQGDYKMALLESHTALFIKDNLADAYERRGDIHLREKDYEKAIVEYTTALRINPLLQRAWVGLADAYVGQNGIGAGLKTYQKAFQFTGLTCPAGAAHVQKKEYKKALAAFRATFEQEPESPLTRNRKEAKQATLEALSSSESLRNRFNLKLEVDGKSVVRGAPVYVSVYLLVIDSFETIPIGAWVKVVDSYSTFIRSMHFQGTVSKKETQDEGMPYRYTIDLSAEDLAAKTWEDFLMIVSSGEAPVE